MGIDIKNKIIIFDEAHNIENKAEECCSMELKIEDLMNHNEIVEDNNLKCCIKRLK